MLSRTGLFMCRANGSTTYLYPKVDIDRALATTAATYTFDGTNIVCPTISDILSVYYDIYAYTTVSNPGGNPGYSCNAGTLLEDMGEKMQFMLENGEVIVKWQLVKQLSPQTTPPVQSPGDSPLGTVGFVTVFCAYGANASSETGQILDPPSVIRLG